MTNSPHKFNDQTLILPTDEVLADTVSALIIRAFKTLLETQERIVFLPSSGQTPVKTYARLTAKYRNAIDWSRVTIVQMDEYKSDTLPPDLYFRRFLERHLVEPLGVQNFIAMTEPNTGRLIAPQDFAAKIQSAGPIDFALHGIGRNGHVGFNEPGSDAKSVTRIVELAPKTRQDNFPQMEYDDSPSHGMTLGLKDLARVKHTLLIATGEHKADAIQRLISRSSVYESPACALFGCNDFGILIDRQAAKAITT